ncbi:hypothetical protein BpHYR1_003142 [Brachionus plicatilis]|uniref:Uncharacterized protein n=1 Tax=Brachionus plicatilis TaxID=10195 RepID=A0A3M7QAT1_BRAPC|nr:hypothetical protein BpHYR1_003142 [Brachionus plicatilis]
MYVEKILIGINPMKKIIIVDQYKYKSELENYNHRTNYHEILMDSFFRLGDLALVLPDTFGLGSLEKRPSSG